MKIYLCLAACFIFLSNHVDIVAQDKHDVYSFSFQKLNTRYTISNPKYLTNFNDNGYNNQPHFIDQRNLLLSCQLSGQDKTDILALNLFAKKKHLVTRTPEAEYSPQLRPGSKDFNCVRVESDEKTQRLWQFPLNHSSQGEPLFPEVKNVGYYHWLDNTSVAMFLVGDPHSLVVGNADDNSITQITSNI